MSAPDPTSSKDAFFVGYMTVPGALKPFLVGVTLCLLAIGIGAGAALSITTTAPNKGVGLGMQEMTGYLTVDPYPALHMPPSAEFPAGQTILLAGPGKRPVRGNPKELEGQIVTTTGIVLAYEDIFKLLKVVRADIVPASDEQRAAFEGYVLPETEQLGQKVTLTGEIVDSQCFSGAMRPGTGKIHMSCAILCLNGGIPTVLWVRHDSGEERAVLLLDEDGEVVTDRVEKHVALPVAITGALERRGNLLVLKVAKDGIETLGAARSLL